MVNWVNKMVRYEKIGVREIIWEYGSAGAAERTDEPLNR